MGSEGRGVEDRTNSILVTVKTSVVESSICVAYTQCQGWAISYINVSVLVFFIPTEQGNSQYGAKSLMRFRLYVLKSVQPKGVSAGTANPVVPLPVKDAFKVGATVKVDVYALSPVPATAAQMILTVLADWLRGFEV
jgi:hypothetical protein